MLADDVPPLHPDFPWREPGASATPSSSLGLPPERARALRNALAEHACGEHPPADELQALLREASIAARARGIPAERLLVEFKLLWYALPEVRAPRPAQQSAGLGELVTCCIRAYFGTGEG